MSVLYFLLGIGTGLIMRNNIDVHINCRKGGTRMIKKQINPNILNEGNQMDILQDNEFDELQIIVRCNNCGKPTEYGKTRMCSGFVGCDNTINVSGKEIKCYFDDLLPRVMKYKNSSNEEEHKLYKTGKVYRWRDNINESI